MNLVPFTGEMDSPAPAGLAPFTGKLDGEKDVRGESATSMWEAGVGGAKRLASSVETAATAPFVGAKSAGEAGVARGKGISERPGASLADVKSAYDRGGILSAAGEVISQVPKAIAEQFPNLAAMAAGAKGGAMAGAALPLPPQGRAAAAVIGAGIGAFVPSYVMQTGSNIERQAQENAPISGARAALTAIPQAAIDTASAAFAFGKLLGIPTKLLGTPFAEKLAQETIKRSLLVGGAKGLGAEVPGEVTQQALERYQAGLSLTDAGAMKEYAETAYQTALMSGPLGGVSRTMESGSGAASPVTQPSISTPTSPAAASRQDSVDAEELLKQDPLKVTPAAVASSKSVDEAILKSLAELNKTTATIQTAQNNVKVMLVNGKANLPPVSSALPDTALANALSEAQRKLQEVPNVATQNPITAAPQTPQATPSEIHPLDIATPGDASRGAVSPAILQSLQNRNRNSDASVMQMNSIAANPNPKLLTASPTMENGAPVVTDIANTGIVQQFGNQDVITTGKREIPFRYAVVEADQLAASNSVDGSRNPEYANNPDKLTAINNGRAAGITEAYSRGTAEAYRNGITEASAIHGISPEIIQGMNSPVLVRVINTANLTPDIADESNTSGTLGLSAVENARNDAQRVDIAGLTFNEDGSPTNEAIRGFISAMPKSEQQNLAPNGTATKQAIDRILGASLHQAYGSNELVELAIQSVDPEARTVIAALSRSAPVMMRLEGADALDIRPLVVDAAKVIINAGRMGVSVTKLSQQGDLTHSAGVRTILNMFARNIRSAKAITEFLNNAAIFAADQAAHNAAGDMFGETGATRQDVLRRFENDTTSAENLGQPERGAIAQENAREAAIESVGSESARPTQAVKQSQLTDALRPLNQAISKFKGAGKTNTSSKVIYDAVARLNAISKDNQPSQTHRLWFATKAKTLTKNGDTKAAALFDQVAGHIKQALQPVAPIDTSAQPVGKAAEVPEDNFYEVEHPRRITDNEDNSYHYTNGNMGMTSGGSFTADKSRWMVFTRTEAEHMDKGDIKPYGATKHGIFVGTESGRKLTKPQMAVAHSAQVQSSPFALESETQSQISAREKQVADEKKRSIETRNRESRKERAISNQAEKDRRAADIIKEREAQKAIEIAPENFVFGGKAPESVDSRVSTEEARGQRNILSRPTPAAKPKFTYSIKPEGNGFVLESDNGGGVVIEGKANHLSQGGNKAKLFDSVQSAEEYANKKGMEITAESKPADTTQSTDSTQQPAPSYDAGIIQLTEIPRNLMIEVETDKGTTETVNAYQQMKATNQLVEKYKSLLGCLG